MTWTFYIYDPGWSPGDDPENEASASAADANDRHSRALLAEFEARIEELGGQREPRMPEVCAGDHVGLDFVLGVTSGLTGSALVWLGGKLREFMQTRKRGATGDVHAIRAVALYHLAERYPDARPDLATIESLGKAMPPGVVADSIEGIFLYRVRDLAAPRVFVIEVASNSDLVSLTAHENRW